MWRIRTNKFYLFCVLYDTACSLVRLATWIDGVCLGAGKVGAFEWQDLNVCGCVRPIFGLSALNCAEIAFPPLRNYKLLYSPVQ